MALVLGDIPDHSPKSESLRGLGSPKFSISRKKQIALFFGMVGPLSGWQRTPEPRSHHPVAVAGGLCLCAVLVARKRYRAIASSVPVDHHVVGRVTDYKIGLAPSMRRSSIKSGTLNALSNLANCLSLWTLGLRGSGFSEEVWR